MSQVCGGDHHGVGLELPGQDNEFIELLRFIQPSTSNLGSQNESLFASCSGTFSAKQKSQRPEDQSSTLAVVCDYAADQMMSSFPSHHMESHGDNRAALGLSDSKNGDSTRWGSIDDIHVC